MNRLPESRKYIIFRFLPLLFIIISILPVFAFEFQMPDWEIVADGIALCNPVKTSWGFITVTDGRTLIGWTENGRKMFQRQLIRKPSSLLCVDYADFIYSLSYDMQYLTCFNPDGLSLWELKLPEKSTDIVPLTGLDGRIFVLLESSVLCVNINGEEIWRLPLESSQTPSLTSEADGSILVNGIYKVSPFGSLLAEEENNVTSINRSSSVSRMIHTVSCDFETVTGNSSSISAYDFDGTLLWAKSFTDEKAVYFAITDRTIMTLSENWVIAGYRYNSISSSDAKVKSFSSRMYENSYNKSESENEYHSLIKGLNQIIQHNDNRAINQSVREVLYDYLNIQKAESSGLDFSSLLSEIILKETDTVLLETAVNAAGKTGRDHDGRIFDALELRLKQRTQFQFDDRMYAAFCDSIYEICRKSGTDDRMLRALEIISPLTNTDYSTLVCRHAADTIEKLLLLQTIRVSQ